MFRTTATVLSILAFAFLVSGYSAFGAESARPAGPAPNSAWVNALIPKGTPGPELTLASRGRARYQILLPARPSTQEQKAADDLALWLGQMAGARFRIIREQAGVAPGSRVISVGSTGLLDKASLWQSKTDLGNEGYAIGVRGDTLFLLGGRTRGMVNAVYALLEDDLGCRWYDRHTPTIPKMRELRFRPVPRKYAPVLEIRDPFYHDAFNRDWSLHNRTNAPDARVPEEWGGHVDYALFVHTYNTLMPPNEFFKDHPGYYSELGGKRKPQQLCLTNPDVFRIVVERVKARLAEKPNSEIISVSPNDWMDYCECASCKAIDDAEGGHSGSLIWFVNRVAEAIEKDYPNVKVSTLAYLGTFKPPATIRPRHNVAIQLCTDSHSWTWPFEYVTETEKFQNALKGWAAIGATIHIWDYTVNFSHHILPMPNMAVVTPDIRFYIRHNAKGVMLQGFYECSGSEGTPMRLWVWAKQLWDPTLDTRELMRDFIYGYYGDAAEPIWKYNDLLWSIWAENHAKGRHDNLMRGIGIRYPPDSAFLSADYVSQSSRLFDEAERLANNPETLRRVKLAKLPLLYTKLSQGIGFQRDDGKWKDGNMTPRDRPEYTKLLDEFEAIAKAENITHIREAFKDAENRLAQWREKLADQAPAAGTN